MPEAEIDVELMVLEESVIKSTKARPTYKQVTGRPGRTYAQWAAEHVNNFL